MLRQGFQNGIFVKLAVPMLPAMTGAFGLWKGLVGRIGYVKNNNQNYHHLLWQLCTFVFVKSFTSLKLPQFGIGFLQTQLLPAAVLRISFGKSWQFLVYFSVSLVSVRWYSWLTSYEIILYDPAVDTLTFAAL